MQVIELINALDKLPEDADIVIRSEDGEHIENVTMLYDEDLNEVVFMEQVSASPKPGDDLT